MVLPDDGFDVSFGAGKTDLLDERDAVGRGNAGVPFQDVAAAGIVIRQSVRDRVICFRIAAQKLLEIPGTCQRVGSWIKAMLVPKTHNVLGVSPFLSGDLLNLHQTDLIRLTANSRIESAFAPYDRLDE